MMLTDEEGDVVEGYYYDAFGSPIVVTSPGTDGDWLTPADGSVAAESTVGNPYLFTGRRYDAETGLYYYRLRMYHPWLGRFMQPDPIHYGDGMNLYAYCHNNPVNGRDPMGLEFVMVNFLGQPEPQSPHEERLEEELAAAAAGPNPIVCASAFHDVGGEESLEEMVASGKLVIIDDALADSGAKAETIILGKEQLSKDNFNNGLESDWLHLDEKALKKLMEDEKKKLQRKEITKKEYNLFRKRWERHMKYKKLRPSSQIKGNKLKLPLFIILPDWYLRMLAGDYSDFYQPPKRGIEI